MDESIPTPVSSSRGYKFPLWRRIRSSADFERIYTLKQRVSDQCLLIFASLNELGYTRIGLSVSRKHGNSVARHRLRRLLKEAFRLSQHDIPAGLDLILIPQKTESVDVNDFRESLVRLTGKLSKRMKPLT